MSPTRPSKPYRAPTITTARLLLSGAMLAVAAHSAAAAGTAALLEQACAGVPQAPAAKLDLEQLGQRIADGQTQRGAAGLDDACLGWRQLQQQTPAAAPLLLTDWEAKVAASLVWLGRSAEAEPLLEQAYQRYQAAGPGQAGKSSMVAGMLAVIWIQRSQVETAAQWSQRAVDAAAQPDAGLSRQEILHLRLNHGGLLSRLRRFEEAQTLLNGLLEECLAQPDSLAAEAAAALNALANIARRQSQLETALSYTEREIDLRQRQVQQDPINLANARHNRGLLLMNLARFDEAEQGLLQALQQANEAQKSGAVDLFGHQASVRETLSGLLLARGRAGEALKVAQDAVAALAGRAEASTARGARPLRRQAEAQLALGQIGPGVASFRKALALLATSKGAPEADTAQAVRLGYTLAMIELGDLEEAAATLQVVASDKRPRSADEQARFLTLQASLSQRRGDNPAAAKAWLAADQALAPSLPAEHPDRRLLQVQACELQAAECPATNGGNGGNFTLLPHHEALMQLALARRARHAGQASAAESAAQSAVAAAFASGQPRLQWQALALWADVRADAGELGRAIFLGKLALDRLQQQREQVQALGSLADARYLADKAPLYRRVADWLLQAQRMPEALEVMRLLKRQEQADFNERGLDGTAGDGLLSLTASERAARQRIDTVLGLNAAKAAELRQLSERAAAQRITAEERARLQQLQQGTGNVALLNELLAGLQAQSPAVPRVRADQASRALTAPAGQLHVHTLVGEDRLSLLLVGRGGSEIVQLDITALELARQVAELRDQLLSRSAPPTPAANGTQAHALYQRLGRLVDRAARKHQAGQIVIWLDGPLRYLQPGLLQDGSQYLASRYRWLVAGGLAPATAHQKAQGQRTAGLPQITAFGVTQSLQGLPALPAVAEELCDIVDGPVLGLDAQAQPSRCAEHSRGQGPMPGEARLNAMFTEPALSRATAGLRSGDLLHIGTHFVLRPGSVAKSWLLLGDGQRLALERLRSIELGRPSLVTLSACETGVLDAALGDGREVDGLAATLLDRGASQVLASLWRVDDRATARFMQRFYAAYALQRGDASAALQTAQKKAMAEGTPPRDWAAFVLLARLGS
ncbi:CHAT domain-containing protein [Pelomonas sp. V22]|uniref:CHAT domain-containing protein n=1 Tax=Pelomonas sp. V22 TaxID=2822139 RepID=UPI0024A91892|nr:CHAT domain-containing protein [Pelomonas sp. V22]MDI4634118.1 CHAT domain-containing protein [Pelomonas sp. V22]